MGVCQSTFMAGLRVRVPPAAALGWGFAFAFAFFLGSVFPLRLWMPSVSSSSSARGTRRSILAAMLDDSARLPPSVAAVRLLAFRPGGAGCDELAALSVPSLADQSGKSMGAPHGLTGSVPHLSGGTASCSPPSSPRVTPERQSAGMLEK